MKTTDENPTNSRLPELDPDARYEITRIIVSKSEHFRGTRARINQRLNNFYSSRGTEYMQNKISVVMPDGKVIADYATYSSFIKVVKYIGFDRAAALNIRYKGYPLVLMNPRSTRYKQAFSKWHVLANWPTVEVAKHINIIADRLDLHLYADVVAK